MDWSWILSILKTDERSIEVGRYATMYTEFLRKIKKSFVRPSPVFPKNYTEFLYKEISMCWQTHTHSNVVC